MEPTQHDVHVPAPASVRGADGVTTGRRSRVRAIARAAGRTCSRPGCDTPAAATLVFTYQERVARIVDLLEVGEPQTYDLCPAHADRTQPPVGWELSDTRPPPSDGPRRLEDEETVEVLAAALRGETPRTRVSVLEGGRADEVPSEQTGTDGQREVAAASTGTPGPVVGDDLDEDPLRAALEELQRIATPDDDVAGQTARATPLRRPATMTPPPPPPSETETPTGPPPPPPPAIADDPGTPTLW